ncbi:glycine--tRNA ligase subunit beta [Glacieibacterium sp.]|uniref:glycine--tRNA ligase subunit beta n=1 Tax=Glacieibacterium sp. TaxID=2860237 RepID=UPI003AFF98D1
MPDFILELLTEEIPARMQSAAADQLRARFTAGIAAQLPVGTIETHVTPRRLILIARDIAAQGTATEEERRGPRADAPPQAIEGFLRSTGLARDQLEERDTPKGRFLYAMIRAAGRSAADVIAELVPQIVRDFDWPKSMRWGAASIGSDAPRWVRPLSSVVALLDTEVVDFEAAGIPSGRVTRGHRFRSSGPIEIASAATYAAQLRDAHVLIDAAERRTIVLDGARAAAAAQGLALVEDNGLVAENAGLTEWPVPLLGHFDPAFLDVPREVIQLTMRTNQKYFACTDASGALAPAFVCVANLAAPDGGEAIVAGNRKVLVARLSDAKFFWDQDRAVTLESRLPKLTSIVFHEKLGTVADKVDRVAKLARWLVESGAVQPRPLPSGEGRETERSDGPGVGSPSATEAYPTPGPASPSLAPPQGEGAARLADLADLAEQAARLCKADLVSATVGEFPEVQGIAGRYLALAEGLDPQVADAIRDHYKPVGQGDDVPTAPVSVAVALADKLDTISLFFFESMGPTGSRDPFAIRRAALGLIEIITKSSVRIELFQAVANNLAEFASRNEIETNRKALQSYLAARFQMGFKTTNSDIGKMIEHSNLNSLSEKKMQDFYDTRVSPAIFSIFAFFNDRLKVQQREAGVRSDLIDAVSALGVDDDFVHLLARVRALQAFIDTPDGENLLAGYRRAANILRIEEAKDGPHDGAVDAALLTDPGEQALAAALATALPAAATAVAAEDFTAAMTALAKLRTAVDGFFANTVVNTDDAPVRENRLNLLNELRKAVHTVADFSQIQKQGLT